MRRLHPHQRIGLKPERLLEADRHFGGEARISVEQIARGLARDMEASGEGSDAEAGRFDDLRAQPFAWMHREPVVKLGRHQ